MSYHAKRTERAHAGLGVSAGGLADKSIEELKDLEETLSDSILAYQSLDDLGSPELNQQAWDEMLGVTKKWKTVQAEINR